MRIVTVKMKAGKTATKEKAEELLTKRFPVNKFEVAADKPAEAKKDEPKKAESSKDEPKKDEPSKAEPSKDEPKKAGS